jgi:hypothetical protein
MLPGVPDHHALAGRGRARPAGPLRRQPVQRREHRLQPAGRLAAGAKTFAAQHRISPNWDFSAALAHRPDLAQDFGFSFVATAAGFDHLLQVSVVDAEGRIYRQVYGEDYSADYLTEPLRQLITGTPVADAASLSAIIERVRILCSVYDPRTGKYRVSYAVVLEVAGGATFLLWIIWFFLSEWLTQTLGEALGRLSAPPSHRRGFDGYSAPHSTVAPSGRARFPVLLVIALTGLYLYAVLDTSVDGVSAP